MRHGWHLSAILKKIFQSTHPLRDATILLCLKYHRFLYFNPRTPYGMRHHITGGKIILNTISIHAPLTGCDKGKYGSNGVPDTFQSTHPLRDATYHVLAWLTAIAISIHAPLTGCDLYHLLSFQLRRLFQSTHPLRDATVLRLCHINRITDFNPRTPYGMRL